MSHPALSGLAIPFGRDRLAGRRSNALARAGKGRDGAASRCRCAARERESARGVCVSRKSEMEPRERDSDREKARARECAHKLQAKLMQGRRVPRLGDTADAGGAMLQAISRERACLSRAGRTRPEKPVRDPRPALPRRSTPRHPIAIASTTKPPDPMPYALAAILLPESRAHGCHMQKIVFSGQALRARDGMRTL